MAYNKQQWRDEIPDLTKPIKDASGKQKTDPQTGRPLYELVQEGTRITSARLNHIEDGIETVNELVDQNTADIDTHKKDAVKHITAAERAEWKAKETPEGAQTKADAALSSAKTYADTALLAKADKSSTYSKTETDQRIQAVVGAAPDALDTLKEIGDALNNDPNFAATVTNQLSGKVDKVAGKQLSTEDYSSAEKAKLAGLTPGAGGAGSATDATIGTRTADPSIATPYSLTGTITQWFSWIAKYFKAITGKANPFDAPDITLAATKTHVDNTTVHITATERTAWNAAETNAKNASIPKTDIGAASGVAGLDSLKNVTGSGIRLGASPYFTTQAFLLSLTATSNQKADIIISGQVHGRIRVTVSGGYAGVDARGSLVKVFSSVLSPPNVINSAVSRYVEATENLPDHISIGELGYDTVNSRFYIPIEARSTYINTFSITVESWSSVRDATFALSPVYTGTGATILPKAIPVIEDNTETKSGYKIQKHQLTQNDGKAIRLTNATDLNTLLANGFYNGYQLVNAPTTANIWYYVEVQRHSDDDTYILQKATLLSGGGGEKPIRYERVRKQSTWSTWVEIEGSDKKNVANGYAGLDANAFVPDARIAGNIVRKATEITISGTDLNTLGEGEYLCPSNALALTFLNMPPTKTAFHLKVSKHAGFNQTFTTFNTVPTGGDRLRIFSRNIYNGVFGAWVEIESTNVKGVADGYAGLNSNGKVPLANMWNSLAGAGAVVANMDTLLTAGTYSVGASAVGAPETGFGQVLVHINSGEMHDNSGNWIWQMFFGTTGSTYVRRKVNNGAWQPWVPLWTGYNDANLFVTRNLIANNTDFNTLTTYNGVYALSAATGLTNAPTGIQYGIISVSKTDGSSPFVKQEATDVLTGVTQTRFRTGSNTWTAWVTDVTSGGGIMTAALARNYAGIQYKYQNVVGYANSSAATGTVKITMPKTWSNTMMRLKISGYDYGAGKGAWELTIGAYNFATTPAWTSASAYVEGNAPFNSVRLAHDGTNNCILLGGLTTAWGITSLEVAEFLTSFGGISGWEKGWQAALITSETGITNVLTPTLSHGNANTLNGYSPSVAASPNTIALRDAKGEIAGVSSVLAKVDDTPITNSSAGIMALNYNVTGTDQTLNVSAYLSLMGASNFSLYISYTDPRLGLKNYEICPLKRLEGEAYVFVPAFIRAKAGTEVRLMVVHSDDAFPAYITASIGKG